MFTHFRGRTGPACIPSCPSPNSHHTRKAGMTAFESSMWLDLSWGWKNESTCTLAAVLSDNECAISRHVSERESARQTPPDNRPRVYSCSHYHGLYGSTSLSPPERPIMLFFFSLPSPSLSRLFCHLFGQCWLIRDQTTCTKVNYISSGTTLMGAITTTPDNTAAAPSDSARIDLVETICYCQESGMYDTRPYLTSVWTFTFKKNQH